MEIERERFRSIKYDNIHAGGLQQKNIEQKLQKQFSKNN